MSSDLDFFLVQASKYVLGADRAIALPGRSHPKLLVPDASALQRWQLSVFYPAFKLKAKCWRLLQRIRCALRLAPGVPVQDASELAGFVNDVLLGITHSAVLIGTAGPDQKIIVQLRQGGRVAAYLKVAVTESADRKIKTEAEILEKLPKGTGPRLLKSGVLNGRAALLLSPVEGVMLEAKLPTSVDGCQLTVVKGYLSQLRVSDELFEVGDHPAIRRLRAQLTEAVKTNPDQLTAINQQLASLLEPLRQRRWLVVIQHGDFAPWNVLRVREEKVVGCRMMVDEGSLTADNFATNNPKSRLCAIDWEEGCSDGFPYFDLIHYISQTAALVEKWAPEKCAQYLMGFFVDLPEDSRRAVIKLGLLASWGMLKRSLERHHWILDWKTATWRSIDEL